MIKVYKEDKGYVQTVQLYLGCSDPTKLISCVLLRPIDKTVLLVHSQDSVVSRSESS